MHHRPMLAVVMGTIQGHGVHLGALSDYPSYVRAKRDAQWILCWGKDGHGLPRAAARLDVVQSHLTSLRKESPAILRSCVWSFAIPQECLALRSTERNVAEASRWLGPSL